MPSTQFLRKVSSQDKSPSKSVVISSASKTPVKTPVRGNSVNANPVEPTTKEKPESSSVGPTSNQTSGKVSPRFLVPEGGNPLVTQEDEGTAEKLPQQKVEPVAASNKQREGYFSGAKRMAGPDKRLLRPASSNSTHVKSQVNRSLTLLKAYGEYNRFVKLSKPFMEKKFGSLRDGGGAKKRRRRTSSFLIHFS